MSNKILLVEQLHVFKWNAVFLLEYMEAMICVYTSLLTKKLTLNDNCILCTLYELNDIVKNLNPELK